MATPRDQNGKDEHGQVEDRRSLAATRKKQRSRARILEAAITLCASRPPGAIVIEDILQRSGVSRGTFYAHFNSLADAMTAVTEQFSDQLRDELLAKLDGLDDPVLRIAAATQMTLFRSARDPVWSAALANSRQLSARALDTLVENLIRGREQGSFTFHNLDAAVAILLGGFIQASISMSEITCDESDFVKEVTFMALTGLGCTPDCARDAIARTNMREGLAARS